MITVYFFDDRPALVLYQDTAQIGCLEGYENAAPDGMIVLDTSYKGRANEYLQGI